MLNDDSPDELLVKAWREGRETNQVFDILYRRYARDLAILFRTMRFDDATCEDLVQETFTEVAKHLGGWEERSGLRTWLHKIARHKGLHLIRERSAKKRTADLVSIDDSKSTEVGEQQALDPPDHKPGPWRKLVGREVMRKVRGALDLLADDDRRVFNLRLAGLENSEVAAIAGIPVGTVKSKVFRVRRRLESELDPSILDLSRLEDAET